MHELHGTVITNQKQILWLAYFFIVYIQREHGMELALSLATHMELEVKITCGGSTRTVVSRRVCSSLTNKCTYINLKTHIKMYIKIHINIAPICFGLRSSSGSLH